MVTEINFMSIYKKEMCTKINFMSIYKKEMHTKIHFFSQSVTSTGTIYNSTDKIFCSNDHPFVNYNPITTTKFFSTVQHYIHDEKNLSNITY
jgi:hypothetical protein